MESSYLSENVYSLLHNNAYIPLLIAKSGNEFAPFFDSIQKSLNLKVFDDSYDYYWRLVTDVREHVFQCHSLFERLSPQDFIDKFYCHISWSPYCDSILQLIKDWKTGEKCYLTLLRSTFILERSLGSIFVSQNENKSCPNMLKDILNSIEIRNALGDPLVAYLKLFVGPVTSLNLRNLAWHGFLRPEDLQPAYVSFLFFLFIDIGRALVNRGLSNVKFRSATSNFKPGTIDAFPQHIDIMCDSLSAFSASLCDSVFPSSLFPFLDYALSLLHCRREDDYVPFLDVLCILLPLLENTARHLFVTCNRLPSYFLQATHGVFFCTFDEILAPVIESGATNQLPEHIGRGATTFICDLLEYPSGPRLRDRLSHGELQPKDCSPATVSAVLSAFQCLVLPEKTLWVRHYWSIFHPIELCRGEVEALVEKLCEHPSLMKISCSVLMHREARTLFRKMEHGAHLSLNSVFLLLRQLAVKVSILEQTTSAFHVHRKKELAAHSLRSRQRQNFGRFLTFLPELKRLLRLVVTSIVVTFVRVGCEELEAEPGQVEDLQLLIVIVEKALVCGNKGKWDEMSNLICQKFQKMSWAHKFIK